MVLVGIGVLLPAELWAVMGPRASEAIRLDVDRLGQDAPRSFAVEAGGTLVGGLEAELGGRWNLSRNERTGTAHAVWGSGHFVAEAANADETSLEAVARRFVDAHPDVFGVPSRDLRTEFVRSRAGKTSIIFQQVHRGVPVWGARAHVVIHRSGRIMAFGSDAHPGLELDVTPSLDASAVLARELAVHGAMGRVGSREIASRQWIVPDDDGYRLAWRVVYATPEAGTWSSLVDAVDGSVLVRRAVRQHVTMEGCIKGDVDWYNPCDGLAERGFRDLEICFNRPVTCGFTAGNGCFSIEYPGMNIATGTAYLVGRYANAVNLNGPNAVLQAPIVGGSPQDHFWNDANSTRAERDIYFHVNAVRTFMRSIDAPWVDQEYDFPLYCEANNDTGSGNAYWTWDGTKELISFFTEGTSGGQSYSNLGEMADVVYHEWGHSLTAHIYGGPAAPFPSLSLHEGNSDVLASLLTEQPLLGVGYLQGDCMTAIRSCDNDLAYPEDYREPFYQHANGGILAGFFWDVYAGLALAGEPDPQAVAATMWHDGRILGLPGSFPDQIYWTYIADDDDGNLLNGTAHTAILSAAAGNHGFQTIEVMAATTDVFADITQGALSFRDANSMAWGDYDGDGDDDLYVQDSGGFFAGAEARLLRNDGGGVLADVTPAALQLPSSTIAAWGDYDDDGDEDLYVGETGSNHLFRNDGGGAFVDVASPDLQSALYSSSVVWVDFDNDGDLDLVPGTTLLRNDGGVFVEVAAAFNGLSAACAVWADYDRDEDQDVYLVKVDANQLFRNDGGTFVDVTPAALADDSQGHSAAWGDFDNDGWLDLVIANWKQFDTAMTCKLVRNVGGAGFADVTPVAVGRLRAMNVSWVDYDNDADLDLYFGTAWNNVLLANGGGGAFTDVSGSPVWDAAWNLGHGWADHDGDGDPDLYLANLPAGLVIPPSENMPFGTRLLRNDQDTGNN